jgi:hypothetical protein
LTRAPSARRLLSPASRIEAAAATRKGKGRDGDHDSGDDDHGGGDRDGDACEGGRDRDAFSGNWLRGADDKRYALIGQAISRDGTPGGDYVIGARVTYGTPALSVSAGTAAVREIPIVPCLGRSGRDMAATPAGTELNHDCYIETLNAEDNADCHPLRNVATIPVCTSSNPHPDDAQLISADAAANVYCYKGLGAGLNDVNGTDRGEDGLYYTGNEFGSENRFYPCHVVVSGGVEVIAAKRPSTKTFPRPQVLENTRLRWLPMVPGVSIANP